MLRKLALIAVLVPTALLVTAIPAYAAPAPVSGAIFTTDSTGVPVNLNIYQDKQDVYLNGGPGINAPVGAAGLPAGTYSFQVTDPSGKDLLSTDPVACRQFTVNAQGVIQNVSPGGTCAHSVGADGEDGGATVQLFPYLDTTNNGGVYKVWVTPTTQLNCNAGGNKHCFLPRYSKTDNFKVSDNRIVEIDTRFWKAGFAQPIDGMLAMWTDTNGATNAKYSEYNPAILAFHEAHVEAAEQGTHQIRVADQNGCTIDHVVSPTGATIKSNGGKATVTVEVRNHDAGDATYFVDVYCAG